MANQVELSASELASLDLLIAKKQEDPHFITDIANAVVDVTAAVTATAAAVAAIGGVHDLQDDSVQSSLTVAKNASLEELIELRNNSVLKQ